MEANRRASGGAAHHPSSAPRIRYRDGPMGASTVRSLAAGVCAGVILSAARPPLGLDLLHLPGVGGGTAALFGAVPWILLAGLLGRTARRFAGGVPVLALLSGAALGFALHALVLAALLRPETRLGMAAALCVPAVLLFLCVRGAGRPPQDPVPPPCPARTGRAARRGRTAPRPSQGCLLYTSDAADD